MPSTRQTRPARPPAAARAGASSLASAMLHLAAAAVLPFAVAATLLLAAAAPAAAQGWPEPDAALLERARAILAEAPLVDGHNDLPWLLLENHGGDPRVVDLREYQPTFVDTDFSRMRQGGVGAQFWSAYVPVEYMREGALRYALRQIDMVHRLVDAYPDVLELARTADDVERIHGDGRIASLIGVEGGHAIENSLAALRRFHDLGVRYMTLTHSRTHDWADASTDHARHGGLTLFGQDVVREMNRLGIFVDISHVSAAVMRDALEISEAPVIFSHSSARALVDHPRNVPDDVLRRLSANGGVVMATFVPGFVAPRVVEYDARAAAERKRLELELDDAAEIQRRLREWRARNPRPRGDVGDMADHIEHMIRVAGIDHVGIGSDYYGAANTIIGLEDTTRFPYLFAELLRRGHGEAELRKLAGGNVLRAMRRMEAVAARLQAEREPLLSVPAHESEF